MSQLLMSQSVREYGSDATYVFVHLFFLDLQPTHLANFTQVQSIQYSAMEEKDRKGMLQLNVAGAAEVLFVPLRVQIYL